MMKVAFFSGERKRRGELRAPDGGAAGSYNGRSVPHAGKLIRGRRFSEGSRSMPKVTFVNEKREIEGPAGSNLREEAAKAAISVYSGMSKYVNCLGHAQCGTCRVLVKKGMENLSPKGLLEKINSNTHRITTLATLGHQDE